MTLPTGTRIGAYEIVSWLGAGGMGEVYRARDPRLGREVAIKLIADAFATDASRLRRFEQEARAAGQLNHPNILSVYDVGSEAGSPFIVSELLEGESLRRRIRGGALPPRKAIEYAGQAAEGLAAAHDKGIVHRDMKPDNLFITNEGRVKILDFGIAKLTGPDDESARHPLGAETADGVVMGTAGYMSPEQVRGEAVDARSDIFSLGAILFEMLSGRPAFVRETGADTMAAILKDDLPALGTPVAPALERIVLRCLEKSRESRFQSARDLAFALECLSGTPTGSARTDAAFRAPWLRQPVLAWAFAGALALALALVLMLWTPWRRVPPASPIVLSAQPGTDVSIADSISTAFGQTMTISANGDVIAFQAQKVAGGSRQLHVLRLDQLQAVALPGTEDAVGPFFSPDGLWIGFFANGQLKKIAVTGGAAQTLAPAPDTRGGAWSEDDTIVFSADKTSGTRLLRVSPSGGRAEALASLADGEVIQVWPQFLPGGKGVLYTGSGVPGAYNDANIMVQPLPGGTPKAVHRGGYHGRYLPSGHLVYIHDGTLFAAPFDLERLEVTGEPVRARDAVMSNAVTGGAQFAVSASGTLVYRAGYAAGADILLHWMYREGKTTPLQIARANLLNPVFSSDGRLAMEIREGPPNIWVYERDGDKLRRLTSDPVRATKPAWTPDGSRIAFASARADKSTLNLWWQRADGTGDAHRLTESRNSADAWLMAPERQAPGLRGAEPDDELRCDDPALDGDEASGWRPGTPTVFLNSAAVEREPMFSPDGRWLAYFSDASGRGDVYVRPFPGPGRCGADFNGRGRHPDLVAEERRDLLRFQRTDHGRAIYAGTKFVPRRETAPLVGGALSDPRTKSHVRSASRRRAVRARARGEAA